MVEQEAVNFEVTGSSPVVGAIKIVRPFGLAFFISPTLGARTRSFVKQKLVRRSAAQKKSAEGIFFSSKRRRPKADPVVVIKNCHKITLLEERPLWVLYYLYV